ncbi:MAG TPA: hypothetical protein VLX85_06795 [Stellaceae bacterium]|nr:hypothetical protein [Stellaceae bacterium]
MAFALASLIDLRNHPFDGRAIHAVGFHYAFGYVAVEHISVTSPSSTSLRAPAALPNAAFGGSRVPNLDVEPFIGAQPEFAAFASSRLAREIKKSCRTFVGWISTPTQREAFTALGQLWVRRQLRRP